MCEYCNKEFNETYLSKHIKKLQLNNYKEKIINNNNENNLEGTEGASRIINNYIDNYNDEHTGGQQSCNRTLIVGPSFRGKTHLLLNKLQLIRLDNPEQKVRIITRSPEQYSEALLRYNGIEIEDTEATLCVSVEEDLRDKSIRDYQNCCVVFDDMLDSNQKLIDPYFTRGGHNDLDVYYLSKTYFDLPKRTNRNNSNTTILFQQTLKDVEHIYRDIAGFDMSYDEFKEFYREAWKYQYIYFEKY